MPAAERPSWRRALRLALSALLIVLAARVAWLYVAYRTGGAVRPYHVESAALLFAVVALVVRYMRPRAQHDDVESLPAHLGRGGPGLYALLAALGLVAYAGSIDVGWLSDDYGLVARAVRGDLSPVTETLFRPLPLLTWSTLLRLGAGSTGLHVLNIALHTAAAGMTTLVVTGWLGRRSGLVAGLLFLLSPLAVEPVVWCSGVFDVMAATFVLGSVLAARGYGTESTRLGTRLLLASLTVGALLSKETAVVAPVLVTIDAWRRRTRSTALIVDLALLTALAVAYAAVRVGDATHTLEPSRYGLQRHLFATVGMLALPFHLELTPPFVLIAAVVIIIAMVTLFAVASTAPDALRTLCTGLLWIVVASAPAYGVLISTPDLQGARYLYLAFAGWAAAVAAMLSSLSSTARGGRLAAGIAGVTLLTLYGVAAVRHQQPWKHAAELRVVVQDNAVSRARERGCEAVALRNLPDSVSGAYVFRNSVAEAFRRDRGLHVVDRVERPECELRWNEVTQAFE